MGGCLAHQLPAASGDLQPKFVNRRFVKDRVIEQAIRLAYRDIMFGKPCLRFFTFHKNQSKCYRR